MRTCLAMGLAAGLFLAAARARSAAEPAEAPAAGAPSISGQGPNTWVKRSPLPGGPGSPRLGYESSWDYDPAAGKMIRWGGHDPGGGGPQLTETWTYEVRTARWEYLQTNNNPPGNCCCRENVQCPLDNRFYRFSYPAFGHGWFWDRSRYLREDSVWTFDLSQNRWTNLRPGKEPALNVGKQACWDPNHQVFWVYDTKLRVYDPYTNTWSTANQSKEIGKRDYAGMALDPVRNRLVLFGDQGKDAPQTWAYDIAADRWIDLQPRGELPPGKGSGPTMVYDSRNDRMIAVVLGTPLGGEGPRPLSTWVYDPGANEWQKMNPPQEPDPAGNRAQLMRYLPDLNLVILENRAAREQQVWTYRPALGAQDKASPVLQPAAPEGVQVVTLGEGRAEISWAAGKLSGVVPFNVYRGDGEFPWRLTFQKVTPKPIVATNYTDTGLAAGKTCYYHVTTAAGQESAPSLRVRAQPKLILDSRADVLAKDTVVYSWKASGEKDVVGYVVERAALRPISGAQKVQYAAQYADKLPLEAMVERAALGPFERLTPKPITETSFTDNVDLSKIVEVEEPIWQPYFGKDGLAGNKAYDMTKPGCPLAIYAYRVRAVNRLGVEGGPSPYQMTVANEVENLFAKERAEGGCDLKWDASPHREIKGYLVFRLNGRGAQWDKDSSVVLLTPEPVKETTFTDQDEAGGGKARQYYVVVVDSLGQQGLASHGAWSRRKYWKHYEPWLPKDGWHQ